MIEPVAIDVHVGEFGPEQRQVGEGRRHVGQIERHRFLGDEAAMAVLVIVAVGKAVAGEQHALLGVKAPPGGAQIADHRLDRHQGAAAELDLVALVHRTHAVFVLRERQVIVADVADQERIGKVFQDAAEPAAMRRLLVGDEQIFERRHAAGEQLVHVPLDDRKILRVPGLDQDRGLGAGDQVGGVIAVIALALVALRQAVADPEHAGRDLARHALSATGVSSMLLSCGLSSMVSAPRRG